MTRAARAGDGQGVGVPECEGRAHETMVWYRPLEVVVACSPTLEESYRRATTQGPITDRGFTRTMPAKMITDRRF